MIDFFKVVPQFKCFSFNFFLTCLFTCSHHMFEVFSNFSLYSTIVIFPWLDNALSESMNLILLKIIPNLLLVIKSFSSFIVQIVPDCAKLVKYCCNILCDFALSPSVSLNDDASSATEAATCWTLICSTECEATLLCPSPCIFSLP